ncbi:MAG TPA: hypothetical protein VN203_26790, partial [Candidatus Acidoferrum sp.]|nr:hypothetical protein [Candidatus Acidoferrum sp.]
VGGTSWLYLTGRPVQEVGLLALPSVPPSQRTEAIQHGIFKYGIIPMGSYGLLAGIMWVNLWRHPEGLSHGEDESSSPSVREPEGGAR